MKKKIAKILRHKAEKDTVGLSALRTRKVYRQYKKEWKQEFKKGIKKVA